MPQKLKDLSTTTRCPKCGYDPNDAAHERLFNVSYIHSEDRLYLFCPMCGYGWTDKPLDADGPEIKKVK